jgi:hypothetical protein
LSIATEPVEYCDAEVNLTGQFVWDHTLSGKRPGILVVHGGAGLDEHAKGAQGVSPTLALSYSPATCMEMESPATAGA